MKEEISEIKDKIIVLRIWANDREINPANGFFFGLGMSNRVENCKEYWYYNNVDKDIN